MCGDRIPVGAKFSAPFQTDPGAYPSSHTIGTRSFRGVNWLDHGVDHQLPPNAEVKGRIKLYFYFLPGPEGETVTERNQ